MEATILVVDDDEVVFQLLKGIFAEPSYKLLWAKNAEIGLQMVGSEFPDLVILDIHMPGGDGREVCRRLRAKDNTLYLPILVLTGDYEGNLEVECLALGADDFVAKPFLPEKIMARVRNLIGRRRFKADPKGVMSLGAAALEPRMSQITVSGKLIALTRLETEILALLMAAGGKLVESKELSKKVLHHWPQEASAGIRVHISHIRQKLRPHESLIETKRQAGYRFNLEYANKLLRA